MVRRSLAFAIFFVFALTIAFTAFDPPRTAELGPALQAALEDSAGATTGDDGRLAVWVFFRDRGLSDSAMSAALDRAEAALDERTARRRAKMKADGERLVDAGDLPVHRDYIQQAEFIGAQMRRESRWLNAASFDVAPDRIAELASLDCVERIDLVARSRRAAIPTPVADAVPAGPAPSKAAAWTEDYGQNLAAMEQVNVPPVHEMGLTGAGVVIGFLDTGFRTTHECLTPIPVLDRWDFVSGDAIVDNEEGDPETSRNHGTEVMSTAMGYAPGMLVGPGFGASAILGRTEDVSQEVPVEEDNWVAGLEWAEGLGADIVSSSLGYYDWYTQEDLDGETCVTTIAADLAVGRGVVVVNSSGNERNSTWGTLIAPSDGDSVITIGAVTDLGTPTYFTSHGPTADGRMKPDVVALGYGNTTANPTDDHAYINVSGTSFSCPLVSGVVSLILERHPSLTPLQVREALRATGSRTANPDTVIGWGIVDAYAAVNWFGPKFAHTPLEATMDNVGPYVVTAVITDNSGVDPSTCLLQYRVNGGAWIDVAMTADGGDSYSASIPGQAYTSVVQYRLSAAGFSGVPMTLPDPLSEDEWFAFAVSPSSPAAGLPGVTALLGAAPNPFNPLTSISFNLAAAGRVDLEVYDARGRFVRSIVSGSLEAGPHTRAWDGRDAAGREAGSGTYLFRLRTADGVLSGKMQLVR